MSRTTEMAKLEDPNEKQESRHIEIECGAISEDVQRVVQKFLMTPLNEEKRNVVKVECNTLPKKLKKQAEPNKPFKIKMMKIECDAINEDVDKVMRNFFKTPPPTKKKNRKLVKTECSTLPKMSTEMDKENEQKTPKGKKKRKNKLLDESLLDLKRMKLVEKLDFDKQEKP